MIDGELAALQAASQSDGTGRVLGMDSRGFNNEQMSRVRTYRRLPVILVTSMHGSRGDSAQVEKSLERGVKEEKTVSEASGRKQDSDERWESEEA